MNLIFEVRTDPFTNAVGYLTRSNQVTYRDCFNGIKADLVCNWRRSGFECDLVFREQPPTPGDYGLDEDWSTLQMVTEFFNTPDPQQIPGASDDWFGLQDSTLKFGKLTMKQGKAFAFNGANSVSPSPRDGAVPVYKRWVKFDGRKFLIEEVPVIDLAEDLNALPLTAKNEKAENGSLKPEKKTRLADSGFRSHVSGLRTFPAPHTIVADTNQILLAAADLTKEPGVVLDYNEIIGDNYATDFTFYSGQTYYIYDGWFYLGGHTTFEGGAVLKYKQGPNSSAGLDINCGGPDDTYSFPEDPGNPVFFISADDNTLGEVIEGSTGNPAMDDLNIYFAANSGLVRNARFYYPEVGISCEGDGQIDVENCQFWYCLSGCVAADYTIRNSLFVHCYDAFYASWGDVSSENTTIDDCEDFWANGLTNCLITAVNQRYCGATNHVVILPSTGSVYRNGACAAYYLATNSPYRNVGTTAIDPDLLAELQTKTTYAPQDGGYLDTDTPDLGYHYPKNEDGDHDGLADWWEWHWFGGYAMSGTNLDAGGYTLLSIYQNYANGVATNDPNVIEFSIGAENDYVNTTTVGVQLDITAGTPSYYAVLVNDTNWDNASWYSFVGTNLTVPLLATTDGVYTVTVGLKGYAAEATETWRDYAFYLDRVAPALTITNPAIVSGATITVIKPFLQLQGFAAEPLASLSYDLSNAVEVVTNQNVFVADQYFDENKFDFTTNYFQAYDVPLATNDNWITLRVTDRAGNTTTTNFNVVLDYSGATNPPTVTLIWPLDGMAVSGTNITIRGTMDEETGTIVATVVNGDGTTNVINGLVERNNMFWIENVPLNGTNQIKLQAIDASGKNETETNFTVNPSAISLTIDSTPTGEDLYKPIGMVSGTVSDSSAVVTVNGVSATVNGNSWSASNVPNLGRGTATFTAMATAPGSASQASVDKEYEARLEVVSYEIDEQYRNKMVATTWGYDWNKHLTNWLTREPDDWHRHASGSATEKVYSNNDGNPVVPIVETYYDYWSDTNEFETYTNSYGGTTNFVNDVPEWIKDAPDRYTDIYGYTWVIHYYADNVDHQWGTNFELKVAAHTLLKIYTGGKAKMGRKNLFCFQCSGTEYGKPPYGITGWEYTPTKDIPAGDLEVFGQKVGVDGKLWIVLDDNTEPLINLCAPGKKHYNADATPAKCKLVITANDKQLEPDMVTNDANFCVGQNVVFVLSGLPADGSVSATNYQWSLDGIFVNDWTNAFPGKTYPDCSKNYFLNTNLLKQAVLQSNWWISGTNPPAEYLATVSCDLLFTNGSASQSVFVQGKFSMFRPKATWVGQAFGSVEVDASYDASGKTMLHFGTTFWPSTSVGMAFQAKNTDKGDFSGDFDLIQLRDSESLKCGTNGISWHNFGAGLDAPKMNEVGSMWGYPPTWIDSPAIECKDENYHVEMKLCNFDTFLMFTPSGGISVPIKLIKWNWFGSADKNPSWYKTSGNGGVTVNDQDTMTFPSWTNVVNGQLGTGFTTVTNNLCQ